MFLVPCLGHIASEFRMDKLCLGDPWLQLHFFLILEATEHHLLAGTHSLVQEEGSTKWLKLYERWRLFQLRFFYDSMTLWSINYSITSTISPPWNTVIFFPEKHSSHLNKYWWKQKQARNLPKAAVERDRDWNNSETNRMAQTNPYTASHRSNPLSSVKTDWELDSSLGWEQVRQQCNCTLLSTIIWLLDLLHRVNEGLDFYKSFLLHQFVRTTPDKYSTHNCCLFKKLWDMGGQKGQAKIRNAKQSPEIPQVYSPTPLSTFG